MPTQLTEESSQESFVARIASNTKAAGQLMAKQTELKKLESVNLPAAFREIASKMLGNEKLRGEFPDLFSKIDGIDQQIKEISSRSQNAPPEDTGGRIKNLAGSAKDSANKQILEQKRSQALAVLGKAIFSTHGGKAGDAETMENARNILLRIENLSAEISKLNELGNGSFLSPKKIAIGGLLLGAFMILLGVKWVLMPARPVYAHFEGKYEKLTDEFFKLPQDEREAAFDGLKREVNTLLANTKPPKFVIEKDAYTLIDSITVGSPEFDSGGIFGLYFVFPLELGLKSKLSEYETYFKVKIYSPDGVVVGDCKISQRTTGSPGEKVTARTTAITADQFYKASHYSVSLKDD